MEQILEESIFACEIKTLRVSLDGNIRVIRPIN
jgi:hypothetical protein